MKLSAYIYGGDGDESWDRDVLIDAADIEDAQGIAKGIAEDMNGCVGEISPPPAMTPDKETTGEASKTPMTDAKAITSQYYAYELIDADVCRSLETQLTAAQAVMHFVKALSINWKLRQTRDFDEVREEMIREIDEAIAAYKAPTPQETKL